MTKDARLLLPADVTYLAPALSFVESLSEKLGFPKPDGLHICLALEEAFTNVVRHGFRNDPGRQFEIICRPDSMGLSVAVRDKGMPFDPREIQPCFPTRLEKDPTAPGLGTLLMKSVVDELVFTNRGREGKELKFTKYLKGKRIDRLGQVVPAPAERGKDKANTPGPVTPPVTFELRAMVENDAVEISRCAYRSYGYTYEDYIYFPERIMEMNRQGLLKSVVAVDSKENFLGHMALKFNFPGDVTAECGAGSVNPAFRRLGLMGKMDEWLQQEARRSGMRGLYGRAVTSHPASQKMCLKQGYRPCGILLGNFPGDVDFKNIAGPVKQRETGVVCFKRLTSRAHPVPCHPPERHKAMIRRLFDSLEVPVTCDIPKRPPSPVEADTLYREKVNPVLNVAEITVTQYGQKAKEEIRDLLKKHCLEKREVIHLWLDLQNPGTPDFARAMADAGFIFAGILPFALAGNHALLLQYLNNVPLDLTAIHPVTDLARDLLAYVAEPTAAFTNMGRTYRTQPSLNRNR